MTTYGPNDAAVRRLIDAARMIPSEDARALVDARIEGIGGGDASNVERTAMHNARRVAKRADRLEAFEAARTAAATAYRLARRGGDVVPWLAASTAITNAASALVVGDLLDLHDYEVLYRPWREAVAGAQLVPVGPGGTISLFGVPGRRRALPRTLGGPDR